MHLALVYMAIQQLDQKNILLEDNHLIAVNKMPSQIVQGDKTGDIPLSDLVKEYIRMKYQKPGNVFIGVIHRLDRPVSGVVLFAKTSKALSRMNDQFRNRSIQKKYWAIVRGKPAKENDTCIHYLLKNEKTNTSRVVSSEKEGGLRSELRYKSLKQGDNYSLLEVVLLTGRHHQIRVQLSSLGTPIVGDVKYGDKRANDDRSICLHARELEFEHPITKEKIKLKATPPNQKYWDIFKPYDSTLS